VNISAPFIQRPIATALLMVGLLAAGLIAYPLLPVAALPSVNYPTLTVTAHDKKFESPIGGDGTFFLDSPPPGHLPATIDFDQGTCSFTIDVQDSDQSFIKLGTLSCAM